MNATAGDASSGDTPSVLRLRRLRRTFGKFVALAGIDLDVKAGELFTLLGPSGCGKTTTLRLVAGLDTPDDGEIWSNDQCMVDVANGISVPPHRRNMGIVFQSYAIWPHMTVFENVAYPLRARRVPREDIERRVAQAIARVGLSGLENRPGPALSGGQQQRVAMARALVYEPKILLLDEPFSNLDAKLREQMRLEIRKLLKELGLTVLMVTHDQIEALGMSDRIALMNGGQVEQIGTAIEVYENPKNPFVRDFLGRVVLLRGSIAEMAPHGRLKVSLFERTTQQPARFHVDCPVQNGLAVGHQVVVAIRPDQISVKPRLSGANGPLDEDNQALGVIESLMFAGERYEARFRAGDTAFIGFVPRGQSWSEGQEVILNFPPKELSVWPA